MKKLHEILGRTATSPEATEVLGAYPNLKVHVEDLGPDEEPVRYLSNEADGLRLKLSSDGTIRTIFLMSEGKEGFSQYRGELPGGLSFSSTRVEALKTFGAPAYFRASGKLGSFKVGELMRFDRPGHSVHFQFRPDGAGIEMVTLMVAEAVPGRSVSAAME
jgi:hypothetical protein